MLLEVTDLSLQLSPEPDCPQVLRGVDLNVDSGEAVGLVGESGSGKSLTARCIAGLLEPRWRARGSIVFDGTEILSLSESATRGFQSRDIGVVFQDPRAHTNPVRTIGDFLTEGLRYIDNVSRKDAEARAVELLEMVRVENGAERLKDYPHEFSGGQLQRIMIAAALVHEPRLILADEPTTALDVTSQADVIVLLDRLRRERGAAMLFITHDLELAAAVCERVFVMYAGEIVEQQPAEALYRAPLHPYTAALLAARPDPDRRMPRLKAIPGQPQSAIEAPAGCAFAPRCGYADARCEQHPAMSAVGSGDVRCSRHTEIGDELRQSAGMGSR